MVPTAVPKGRDEASTIFFCFVATSMGCVDSSNGYTRVFKGSWKKFQELEPVRLGVATMFSAKVPSRRNLIAAAGCRPSDSLLRLAVSERRRMT